jgi:hypothetical protein
MAEQVYYDRNRIRISSTRAVFGSKTFALAAITSVEGRRLHPERSGPYLIILGGVLACAMSARLFMDSTEAGVIFLLIGLAVIGLGVIWASRIGPKYAVILCTSARERKVGVSTNESEIGEIVAALNRAIIDRG